MWIFIFLQWKCNLNVMIHIGVKFYVQQTKLQHLFIKSFCLYETNINDQIKQRKLILWWSNMSMTSYFLLLMQKNLWQFSNHEHESFDQRHTKFIRYRQLIRFCFKYFNYWFWFKMKNHKFMKSRMKSSCSHKNFKQSGTKVKSLLSCLSGDCVITNRLIARVFLHIFARKIFN